jgi:hypothetical protein
MMASISYIEDNFKNYNVWVPSKDTGIDLLVTNARNSKAVSIQVKFSKDYIPTYMTSEFKDKFVSWGWWVLKQENIKKSKANLWVFVMQSFDNKSIECIVIPPKVLLQKLKRIHDDKSFFQSYLWVTKTRKCWETRQLAKSERIRLANDRYTDPARDFSKFYDNWESLKDELRE